MKCSAFVVFAFTLGLLLGLSGYRLLASTPTLQHWCRQLPDAEFYQLSTDQMGMWADGAEIQMEDSKLLRQVRTVGYSVYIPLCPPAWDRVLSEARQQGLDPETMEPWAVEMNVRLQTNAP